MKKLLMPVLVLLFISCGENKTTQDDRQAVEKPLTDSIARVQPDTLNEDVATTDTTNDPIAFIRKRVENINTTPNEKKHFEFMCDERTMADYFYKDGQLVKVSIDFGTVGDVYAKEDYYYDNGALVFKYEFVEGGPACEGCIKTDEYRSYIKDNKVIRYLKNKSTAPCRKCAFSTSSKENQLFTAKTGEEVKNILCR